MEHFIGKNFYWETNDNVLYLKGECYKLEDNIFTFYQVIEGNKVFDIAQDISQIRIHCESQRSISRKEESQYSNDNNIILPVPHTNQIIAIPLTNIKSRIVLPIAQTIYDKLGNCIDLIDNHLYHLDNHNNPLYQDLDFLNTYLQDTQSFILSKFQKK